MRVKLGRRIHFCTLATLCEDSNFILLTSGNSVYTVSMASAYDAVKCHSQLLEKGYYDFSECDYSN